MIDFHSHFFSHVFYETLAKLSPLGGEPSEKLAMVARKANLELPHADPREHLARWLTELDRNGVDHLVSFASVPEEAAVVAEIAGRSGGRITPFALLNPKAEGAPDKARKLLGEMGFKGLLFFPAMHGFHPSGPEALAVYEVCEQHRAVAVVHCGLLQVKLRDLLALPRTYDFALSNPLLLAPAANRYRGVRFVVPHFGAGYFRETLMLGSACDNVLVDTSSSNDWRATAESALSLPAVFERALGVFGAQRILFGTDSSTFPRGWRKDLAAAQRAALAEISVPADLQHRIFDGNARQLLGLAAAHG